MTFAQEDINRAHRIGMEYTEKNSGKKVKSIIVKFKSWSARKQFYDARPNNFKDGKKKPGYKSFSVSVELTKRRYLPLGEARELIKNNDDIDFAFADINCSLEFRYKIGLFRYFNSKNESHNLINKQVIISTLPFTKIINVFVLMIVSRCFQWLVKDKPLFLFISLTSYFYLVSILYLQYTFNSIYIIWSSKLIIYPYQ